MKIVAFIAISLTFFTVARAQTLDDLIRDVRENVSSTSRVRLALQKHASYVDSSMIKYMDTTAFLNLNMFSYYYRYRTHSRNEISDNHIIVNLTYKDERVAYANITDYSDTLFRYVDTTYAVRMVNDYNSINKTDFTWHDLFEDSIGMYDYLDELFDPLIDPAVATEEDGLQGKVRGGIKFLDPITAQVYRPMLINRDHAGIIRNCRSFNPTRRLHGALCLFILEQLGEPISKEEKQLFKTIRRSSERTFARMGCIASGYIPIKYLLSKSELKKLKEQVENFKKKGGFNDKIFTPYRQPAPGV